MGGMREGEKRKTSQERSTWPVRSSDSWAEVLDQRFVTADGDTACCELGLELHT